MNINAIVRPGRHAWDHEQRTGVRAPGLLEARLSKMSRDRVSPPGMIADLVKGQEAVVGTAQDHADGGECRGRAHRRFFYAGDEGS